MIDHVLGRPSTRFRKYQVFTVVLLWSLYLARGNKHGPRPVRHISEYFTKRLSAWRTLVVFCLTLYVSRNFARVVGLESPEPLANLYTRTYFRATWVTTALDAGFWTAMHVRPKWLKDLASMVFTVYYLACAEQADEMVRRVRGGLTLQHLRTSWDKPNTPYLKAVTSLMRPKMMKYPPRQLRIPRPAGSSYTEPINAWLYFDSPRKDLKQHDKVVFDVPGGGFVAMDPRCHDDKLMAWAAKLGLPVLALDYQKAPEYPYPYALNECYDAYHTIMSSRGTVIGFTGTTVPKIVISGDSAGGNLAVGLTCMLLSESPYAGYNPEDRTFEQPLPMPEALVLVYPALDMNIRNWMTEEQMALMKQPERRKTNKAVLSRKSEDYRRLTPDTPHGSDDEDEVEPLKTSKASRRNLSSTGKWLQGQNIAESPVAMEKPVPAPANGSASHKKLESATKPQPLQTRLAISSMISYFNDRILSPEMLRSMIILYIGPHNKPDFATDHLLSPILTPEHVLARFPKTYMVTGERDPLVDDTIIFAGRLRQAHLQRFRERQELGLVSSSQRFDDSKHVEVMLIPGISHGFLQFVSIFPEGRKYIDQCSRWMREAFRDAEAREAETPAEERRSSDYFTSSSSRHHHRRTTGGSEADDRPLEIKTLSMTPASGEGRGGQSRRPRSGRGHVRKPSYSGTTSPIATRRSLVRLASTEDLMSRRMHGLTGGLFGDGPVPHTP
ncbi:hypothetical protein LTR78_005014 [Recurvomyces mirabilis]|uniref:Alpha/beta hydrolase fold-3 domain-containing protein n=1 Tax=Recurvomyces mirabilis TaxID=574656 RepID=A0AAE0WNX7_9PEZI|nr:hypothetical protein LTR78_005014 [Recurvomyces mirabilis]KAK5158370.1 hypothetical protein LTS14_003388 [Recurvomyces mirabilis]